MKNVPQGIREQVEKWDISLKERNKLLDELDDYFIKRKERIEKRNKEKKEK